MIGISPARSDILADPDATPREQALLLALWHCLDCGQALPLPAYAWRGRLPLHTPEAQHDLAALVDRGYLQARTVDGARHYRLLLSRLIPHESR